MTEEQNIRNIAASMATSIATSQSTIIEVKDGDQLVTLANQIAEFIADGTVPTP